MKVLLIVVLIFGCTRGANVWNQTDDRDVVGPSVYAANTCTIHIKDSFHQNMIFMTDNGRVIQPNKGRITVDKNKKIAVSCSENINNRMTIQCIGNDKYKTPDYTYVYIRDLWCEMNTQPKLKGKCLGSKSLIEIGFPNGDSIDEQIEVCFDDRKKQTLYARMTMSKGIDDDESQSITQPTYYREDGRFIKEGIRQLYEDQHSTFMKLLSSTNPLHESVTVGQLVAWADFPYTLQRLLTMFSVNTAPQWSNFNDGNWNELQTRIRSTVKTNDYEVYTGTYGILQLADNNSNNVDMYLSPADNKPNSEYPVPKYFWKVLIEKTTATTANSKGIAFIGRNNVIDAFIPGEDRLCTDIINEINWLNDYPYWNDYTIGRVIACEVADFKTLWGNDLPIFPSVPGGLPIDNLR